MTKYFIYYHGELEGIIEKETWKQACLYALEEVAPTIEETKQGKLVVTRFEQPQEET
jgi:hypothetical protein